MSVKMWDSHDVETSPHQTARASILVVEDFEGVREALAELLITEGYQAVTAANGAEAWEYLQSHPTPEMVLLDLMMPVMDGWQFIRAFQANPRFAGVPIIVLSGVEDLCAKASALDVEGYLRKPVDPEILLQVVEMYCG